MELAPIKSTRIYEEIVRQVKAMIAEGRLKGGDRLPPERDLAEKFVVSRTSVREALRALESLGLVEIRPGEGTFVREVLQHEVGFTAHGTEMGDFEDSDTTLAYRDHLNSQGSPSEEVAAGYRWTPGTELTRTAAAE